jgi:hypothetical protein
VPTPIFYNSFNGQTWWKVSLIFCPCEAAYGSPAIRHPGRLIYDHSRLS